MASGVASRPEGATCIAMQEFLGKEYLAVS